jgi:error-prone DNA polymerase
VAAYAELHCITNYSFLRGASHPEELVVQAAALGYQALAITDECSMAGVVKAHVAAKEHGLKLIVGSEFHLDDDHQEGIHLVLLAANRKAYGQICHLITIARRRAEKGQYQLRLKDLAYHHDQCLALWIPGRPSAFHGSSGRTLCRPENFPARQRRDRPGHAEGSHRAGASGIPDVRQHQIEPHLLKQGAQLREMFKDRLWICVEAFPDGAAVELYRHGIELGRRLDIPLTASGDVHMHHPDRKALLDVVSAVRMGQSVRMAGRLLFAHREKHLRPLPVLEQFYPPALLSETVRIAGRCQFSLDELRYEYPPELVPPSLTPSAYLRQLVEAGAKKRWPGGTSAAISEQIEKELSLIAELQYEYYFLTVFDIVHFARTQGILCQGRGSAANSVVCFCLEITEVDPAHISLLFERFISRERNEPPDIDVDFEHERREEVIQYIYKKYGRDRAALAATVVTYRPKSAIRDVGKALGIDLMLVDKLAKSLSWWDQPAELQSRFAEAGVNPRSPVVSQFLTLVQAILGFPRHLSQHVGGFVISSGPLSQLVPVENAAMVDRTIIQWDKDDLESLGLLKIDILALGMLTSIRKSLDLINAYRNTALSVADIPSEDPMTYQMLQKGDSIGVFQVESRAQISMLPRLKPRRFYDLVVEVAIVRPGPIQGNMVHPYLRRRNGQESVTYANDEIRAVLDRTLGVPIFQEQVIKLAVVAAGFTPGEADQLRRAMAAWKRRGGLEAFQQKLVDGMLARGHAREFAERIFEQIKGFGEYGFPESHAASFALLVYVSAWLKRHEPAAFYCGLLNSQPMGFYSPSQLIQDARRHGIEIRPVDVHHSEWESTLEPAQGLRAPEGLSAFPTYLPQPAIRLGLQRIKGLPEGTALRIIQARSVRPLMSIEDIAGRARLDRGDLSRLTEAGAFMSLSGHRYQTHWDVQGIIPDTPLLDHVADAEAPYQVSRAPEEADDLRADYGALGLTLGRHPMAMLREGGRPFDRCRTANELGGVRHGGFVQVAGIVTGRQRPSSASGVLFLTLEDETNNINVVIWTRVLERFRSAVVQGRLLLIKGVVEKEASVIHVIAGHVEDLSHYLEHLSTASRDFR